MPKSFYIVRGVFYDRDGTGQIREFIAHSMSEIPLLHNDLAGFDRHQLQAMMNYRKEDGTLRKKKKRKQMPYYMEKTFDLSDDDASEMDLS